MIWRQDILHECRLLHSDYIQKHQDFISELIELLGIDVINLKLSRSFILKTLIWRSSILKNAHIINASCLPVNRGRFLLLQFFTSSELSLWHPGFVILTRPFVIWESRTSKLIQDTCVPYRSSNAAMWRFPVTRLSRGYARWYTSVWDTSMTNGDSERALKDFVRKTDLTEAWVHDHVSDSKEISNSIRIQCKSSWWGQSSSSFIVVSSYADRRVCVQSFRLLEDRRKTVQNHFVVRHSIRMTAKVASCARRIDIF